MTGGREWGTSKPHNHIRGGGSSWGLSCAPVCRGDASGKRMSDLSQPPPPLCPGHFQT